jgi:hypothetical protein
MAHWEHPQGRVVMELQIGISQMLWVKKGALTFMSLSEA